MATNLEWDVLHTLVSKYGELDINLPDPITGRCYRIQPDSYKFIPSLRVTQDNISQADGSILHPRWKSGLVCTMQIAFNVHFDSGAADFEPACGQDLREMNELLDLHLNSLRSLGPDDQRLRWQPTGYADERMITEIELLAWGDPSYDLQGTEALVSFSLETPFPYAIDSLEIETGPTSPFTGTVGVTNAGNSPQSPVARVSATGVTAGFTLTNSDDLDAGGNPKSVVYDSTLAGASPVPVFPDYAEISFFNGTVYFNGDGANLIAGIDPTLTDFWRLQPGVNDITITGAEARLLSNNAWC